MLTTASSPRNKTQSLRPGSAHFNNSNFERLGQGHNFSTVGSEPSLPFLGIVSYWEAGKFDVNDKTLTFYATAGETEVLEHRTIA
ncbi:MAG TPA: hypothetical protein V6D37_02675 [Candidatus Sericytochromatia bacterium]